MCNLGLMQFGDSPALHASMQRHDSPQTAPALVFIAKRREVNNEYKDYHGFCVGYRAE